MKKSILRTKIVSDKQEAITNMLSALYNAAGLVGLQEDDVGAVFSATFNDSPENTRRIKVMTEYLKDRSIQAKVNALLDDDKIK